MDHNASDSHVPERRSKPRAKCDYPAIIKGQDAQGRKYEEIARLTNMSASGLYLQLQRPICEGEKLHVTISLPNHLHDQPGHKCTITGVVVRAEPHGEGTVGIALKILHYRFV